MGNTQSGVYDLLSGSSAIDSATSDGAPLTDLIGNPRVDDLGIENIGGGPLAYFDMGALERQKGSDPVNLLIEDIEFTPESGEIGDTVTISWTVRNAGTAAAAAPWSDAIFGSENSTWEISDERLDVFERATTLMAGETYTGSLHVEIPPTLPGSLNFIIRADYRQQVREVDESNDELATVEIDLLTILPGESVTFDLTNERPARYVRVDVGGVPMATDLNILLDDTDDVGSNELHVSYERIPDRQDADVSATENSPDQIVATGEMFSGIYFVLVQGGALATDPSEVTVSAVTEGFSITSISPESGTNNGNLTLLLEGAALTENAMVRLMKGAATIAEADRVVLDQTTRLYATFDLNGVSPGTYAVEVQQTFRSYDEDLELETEDTLTAVSPTDFEVTTGGGANVVVTLDMPSAVRVGRSFAYSINYRNEGTVDAPAPLIALSSSDGTQLAEPGSTITSGFPVLLLGLSEAGPAEVLRPGEAATIDLLGQAPITGNAVQIIAGLGVDGVGGPEFSQFLQNLGVNPDGAFGSEALFNLNAQFGATWSDYFDGLGQFATAFAGRSDPIESVTELVVRAVAGDSLDEGANSAPNIGQVARSHTRSHERCNDVVLPDFTFKCYDHDNPRRQGPDSKPAPPGTNGKFENFEYRPYCEKDYLELAKKMVLGKANSWDTTIGGNAAAIQLRKFAEGVDQSETSWAHDSDFAKAVVNSSNQLRPLHNNEGKPAVEKAIKKLLDAGQEPVVGTRIPLGKIKIKPSFKKDSPFSQQHRAIGGLRLESTMSMEVTSKVSEGVLGAYNGFVEYSLRDRYDFQAKNFRIGAFSRAAYDLGWCHKDRPLPLGHNTVLNVRRPFKYDVATGRCVERAPGCAIDTEPLLPPTTQVAQGTSSVRRSFDPNDKIGPATPGNTGNILEGESLQYTVFFENDPQLATAPAQKVVIEDDLDPDLDWGTFEIGVFAFGDKRIDAPPGLRSFSTQIDAINPDGSPLLVTLSAEIDLLTGRIRWVFDSIDPATGGPPNGIETGFLPVNDVTHGGEGHVTFTVSLKEGLAKGTVITNQANIFFDFNEPIVTPTTRHILDDLVFIDDFED